MYFLVYRKRQRKARLEAASTLNANAAAMTSTNLRNEPNNLPPGYDYSNNSSAIVLRLLFNLRRSSTLSCCSPYPEGSHQ